MCTASHGCVLANTVLAHATGAVRSSEIPTSAASVTTARGCSEAGPGKPNQSPDEGSAGCERPPNQNGASQLDMSCIRPRTLVGVYTKDVDTDVVLQYHGMVPPLAWHKTVYVSLRMRGGTEPEPHEASPGHQAIAHP